ncbi:MAG: U32 family peptidase [Clostridium butyricum]|nr:U32 family peptidase [Clostridium butyricum]
MKKPELLAPAGNLEKLKTAITFGADAVYLGGSKLNLRAFADNFTTEQLKEGLEFAHSRGRKVYVTLNIIPHDTDLAGIEEYVTELYNLGVDAVLVADPGIMTIVKNTVPNLEIHLSTQANCLNYEEAKFWHRAGVKRVVTAREMTFEELKELRRELPSTCEIEAFVHGAMCMGFSGKCYLSTYLTGRDSNRGACAQPCRYKYHLFEEDENGEFKEVIKDIKLDSCGSGSCKTEDLGKIKFVKDESEIVEEHDGVYLMNSKDLCMIEHIPELVESGIDSLKIEGRMKSVYYVASVVKAYRQAIDSYFEDPENYKFNPKWMDYLVKPSHRPFTTGFYFDEEVKQTYGSSTYIRNYDIVGIVRAYDEQTKTATIEQKNKVLNGAEVEVLEVTGDNIIVKLEEMKNKNGERIESANIAQMIYTAKCESILKPDDILIKAKN